MPRVTRSSATAPAPKSTASKDSALQPKSPNVRKRPRNNSSEENDPKDAGELRAVKKTKTRTKKNNAQGWNVSGKYSLVCTSRYQPVDASSYSLELHHHENPNQLFATFVFGDLQGVMRLCPEKALSSKADSDESEDEDEEAEEPRLLMLDEFEQACELADDIKPGPKAREWLMRWRGKDGDEVTGGESRAQGLFNFKYDGESSTDDFKGVKITFSMLHKDKHLLFEGTKKSNLAGETRELDLDTEWKSLFLEKWEVDRPRDTSDDWSFYGLPPTCSWNPPPGGVIKARNKPGPNPGAYPKPKSAFVEAPPLFAWDVSGAWDITPSGHDTLRNFKMTIYMANNPFHSKTGRQLWGIFEIGSSIVGIVRLCPAMEDDHKECSLADFEKACVLDDGVWPGAVTEEGTPNWHFRWRGVDKNTGVAESTGDIKNTEMIFGRNGDGTISFRGSFMWDCEEVPIIGIKKGIGKPRSIVAPTVNRAWDAYASRVFFGVGGTRLSEVYDPVAEEEEEERARNAPYSWVGPVYPPGGIPDYIEVRPNWAWDVAGEWVVESAPLRAELGIPATADLTFSVRFANSPHVGPHSRRLYSVFRLGDVLEGCMRFAPVSSTPNLPDSLVDFENDTHLHNGVWPGLQPEGIQMWKMRYRALDHRTQEIDPVADEKQTTVEFSLGEDKRLRMRGFMVVKERPLAFEATRVMEQKYTNGNEATAGSTWQRYNKSKTESGSSTIS